MNFLNFVRWHHVFFHMQNIIIGLLKSWKLFEKSNKNIQILTWANFNCNKWNGTVNMKGSALVTCLTSFGYKQKRAGFYQNQKRDKISVFWSDFQEKVLIKIYSVQWCLKIKKLRLILPKIAKMANFERPLFWHHTVWHHTDIWHIQ